MLDRVIFKNKRTIVYYIIRNIDNWIDAFCVISTAHHDEERISEIY